MFLMKTWLTMWHTDPMTVNSLKTMCLFDLVSVHSVTIMIFVAYLLLKLPQRTFINHEWLETPILETLWTLYPTFLLIVLCFPSIWVLYSTTSEDKYYMTVKVIGHQWYWSYDYTSFKDLVYESFTLPSEFMEVGSFRLMDVDNRCVVPMNMNIMFILTSMDVIHSFSLPSLCLKTDCNPAYLNSLKQSFLLPALYYGFCSEICGSGHSQMSICVESTSMMLFKDWVSCMMLN